MTPNASVITRFAPSPTGFLHIGGARTALFNWLFARHHGGRFLLRIEDTDRARSTEAAVAAIFEGLRWLELDWDGEPVFQFSRAERHAEIARGLLAEGKAYLCFATAEELQDMRGRARAEGRPPRYDGRWRDRSPDEAPPGVKPVIRFRAPTQGETIIEDQVQGAVRFGNEQLDDMVLLRSDGTPTYMLSVVVDDHDMEITHVIRGDDHLTNAARQAQLYLALGWAIPTFAHVPLIHGPDGAKLSKRHGALGAEAYRDMGYLPEATRNYLLRLGWAHGNDEIIPTQQAIAWFSLEGIGRSPARFDLVKLNSLNGHYIREADDARLVREVEALLERRGAAPLSPETHERLLKTMPSLKQRVKTLVELLDMARFVLDSRPLALDPSAAALLTPESRAVLSRLLLVLERVPDWTAPILEQTVREFATKDGCSLGAVAQPLRAALAGQKISPPIFDVLFALGREESMARIADQCTGSEAGAGV